MVILNKDLFDYYTSIEFAVNFNDVVELPKGTSDKLNILANKDVLAGRKARSASEFKNKTEYDLYLFLLAQIVILK